MPQGVVEERLSLVRTYFDAEVARRHGELQEDPLGRYPGSFLACFPGPSQAIAAAIGVMKRFASGDHGLPAGCVEAGCAINSGEVAMRSGQLIGRPLEIVSRLEYRAEPGQILFTEASFLSLGNEEEISYHPLMRKIGAETGPEMRAFELLWKGGDDNGKS